MIYYFDKEYLSCDCIRCTFNLALSHNPYGFNDRYIITIILIMSVAKKSSLKSDYWDKTVLTQFFGTVLIIIPNSMTITVIVSCIFELL